MLNNSNINNTTTYPFRSTILNNNNNNNTPSPLLPAQNYCTVNQHYQTPTVFMSPMGQISQVGVPRTTTTVNPLIPSRPSSNSTTQLPPIQIMLNSNIGNTHPTNHLLTPNNSTKESSTTSSSPSTKHIVLPPLGFTNTSISTPITSPTNLPISTRSPTPVLRNYIPGSLPSQNINQLPPLSTQFTPHEIQTMTNPAFLNSVSPLILKNNNLTQPLITNPSTTLKQHTKKNFSFVPQSNDYHIVKGGTIMKKSNIQPKSLSSNNNKRNSNNSSSTTSRKRRRTTKEQRQILKDAFMKNKAPSKEERLSLAQRCNMSEKAIQVWFQNQRQYMRREQNLRALQYFQIIS